MMDPELSARLDRLEAKIDAAYKAAHKSQQYLFWTGVITVAFIVLPLLGIALVLPSFINNYVNPLNAATGNPTVNANPGSLQGTLNTLNSLGL